MNIAELPDHGHAIIDASAGTGKTYTLTRLVLRLLETTDATLDQFAIVTFTRRAAADLKRKIREALPEDALLQFDKAEIYTIHSFCQRILTENAFHNRQLFDLEHVDEDALVQDVVEDLIRGELAHRPDLQRLLDVWLDHGLTTADRLASTLAGKYDRDRTYHTVGPHKSLDAILQAGRDGDTSDNWKRDLKAALLNELIPHIQEEVEDRKATGGLYVYDDMLSIVCQRLRDADTDPSAAQLLQRIRAQYRFALIDEFQDTDPEQWEIFRRIFVDGTTDHRLFVIGDPKQAIYGFRGADVWTYLDATEALERLQHPRFTLKHNYRSTHSMVAAYNAIFDQRANQPLFTNPRINYKDPVAPNPDKDLKDNSSPLPAIVALEIDDKAPLPDLRARWLDWMATEIEDLLSGDRFRVEPHEIFVLTNSNREALAMGRYLRERSIPHAFFRQEGLFQSQEALDILTLLQAIEEPGDRSRRRLAIRTPFFAVPLRTLASFDESPQGHKVRQQLLDWRATAERGAFARLFPSIIAQTGVLRREVLLNISRRPLTNYEQLFELLVERAAGGDTLQDLIAWLKRRIDDDDDEQAGDDDSNVQRLESTSGAVQIMTIHKSKGLEADVVFVYGGFSAKHSSPVKVPGHEDSPFHLVSTAKNYLKTCDLGLRAAMEDQSTQECERLMYVAITRPRKRLYLCYASNPKGKARGGRHAPLVRALDRLKRHNTVPNYLRFQPVGPVGSHPATQTTGEVPPERWREVLNAAPHQDGPRIDHRAIRDAFPISTSFSGVPAYTGDLRLTTEIDDAPDLSDDPELLPGDDRFPEDSPILAGGIRPGNLLHHILEHLPDYASAIAHPTWQDWAQSPGVAPLLRDSLDRYRYTDDLLPYTARIVYDTLNAPLELPTGHHLPAIGRATRDAREIAFHFPIPTGGAPRGWVEGFIDLTFEHRGRVYIADWKSNTRRAYTAPHLAPYVDRHYGLQARLYTLATLRLLGINDETTYDARFGGCAYFFIRGMRPDRPGDGVVWTRPTWAEVQRWEASLLEPEHQWKVPMPVFTQPTPEVTR